MSNYDRCYAPVSTLLACLAIAGCDLSPDSDDDDSAGGDESGGDDESDSDDPSGASSADETGDDPDSSGGPDSDTNDTSTPGDALPDSVFVYIHQDGANVDSVRAYDVATNETWVISDFGGNTEINGVAIHPDRTSIAVSAFYELSDADESEGIWRVSAQGGEPENIMPALPGETDEFQSVANLAYSYDGAYIYFDHSTSFGGGTLARVSDTGGLPELFIESNGACATNAAPSPSPEGSQLLGVRGSCVNEPANEGLVLYDAPPTGGGQVLIPEGASYDIHGATAQWSADATVVLLLIGTRFDADGDGLQDSQGDTLMAMQTATGELFTIVPPADGQRIDALALSPDEGRIIITLGTVTTSDLVLVDITGEAPTYTTLTSDGVSSRPAW